MKNIKEENKKRYVADFETAIDLDNETYVWAWALCDCETLITNYGTDIDSFLQHIFMLKDQSVIYFHNLKFDQTFILVNLIKKGWSQTFEKPQKMSNNQFKALTSGLGTSYSITLKKCNKIITICDSLKKLPFSVKKIAKDLCFEEGKGEIDYFSHRDAGGVLSDEDKDYIRRDVEIIAKALNAMFFDKGLYKLTIGSDCMDYFKKYCCKNFKIIFPVLDKSIDKYCRNGYSGRTRRVKNGENKTTKNGSTYDYN